MSRPVIGITSTRVSMRTGIIASVGAYESYLQAVQLAGGLPLIIPLTLPDDALDELFSRMDGILFPGGGDINPSLFNGAEHSEVYGIEDDRDRVELHLCRQAAETGKPFLGICRGIQVANVALGGTLYTHIAAQLPGALKHDWYPDIPRDTLAHEVRVQPGSLLEKITASTHLNTNSLHHQGLLTPAARLTPVAWAPDGLVEAVEMRDHPYFLGVQWHPENLQAFPEMRALFSSFVTAAGG
jgi:putative glutamine amidotransferase